MVYKRKRQFFYVNLLEEKDLLILKDLFYFDLDSPKFIAKRLNLTLKEVSKRLNFLEKLGIIVKHPKGCYELSQSWRELLKKLLEEGRFYG